MTNEVENDSLLKGGGTHVSRVDDAELHVWTARHGSVQKALDQDDRRGEIRSQHGPENAHRIDDRQLHGAALLLHEVPGRAFGESLALVVGAHLWVVVV